MLESVDSILERSEAAGMAEMMSETVLLPKKEVRAESMREADKLMEFVQS